MSQQLQTDVSILSLAHGTRARHMPTARIVEPASGIAPAEGKGNLYILIELEGGERGRSRLYREMLNTIQETYYHFGGDIRASLTSALRAAHAYIQQFNQYHHTDFIAGATCLVATGSEIISAQAGPSILAVRSQAGLQWFSPLNDEEYVPLGGDTPPSVELGRVAGHPGVVMAAMNSPWANHLEVAAMMEATEVPRAQAVADQLAGIGIDNPDELNLLVVTLNELDDQRRPPPKEARPSAVVPPPAPRPAPPDVEEEDMWDEAGPDEWQEADKAPGPKGSDAAKAAVGGAVTGLGSRLRRPKSQPKPKQQKAQAQPAQKSVRPRRRIPYVLGIITLLIIAAAAITFGMWYLQGRQRTQYFNEFLQGAQIKYDAALAADDSAIARQNFQDAEEQLNQAGEFAPDHPDVTRLRNQIAEARARINLVVPLLAGFDQPLLSFNGQGSDPSAVFVNGLSVYVLDPGRGVLERFQLDETTGDRLSGDGEAQLLLQEGVTVGGRQVGDLAKAVWAPALANRTSTGPLVLDRSNQLFGVSESLGPANVTLANSEELGFVQDMIYYAGNVYFLDTGNSQLWRYRPTGENYNIPPEPYFTGDTAINLSQVKDMTIDGAVWLLHPNGTILRYFAGIQEAFALDVVDPPFSDAVAIWANEAGVPGGHLYVADAASNRVLVFDKAGELLSQLMPADHPGILNNLRDMYVDEDSNYLYALTDDALYQVPLPPVDISAE